MFPSFFTLYVFIDIVWKMPYNARMKKIYMLLLLGLAGCHHITLPDNFTYREIRTDGYTLASWQKITDTTAPVRIYIEGDGYAFNYAGQPTSDPTPRGTFLRQIAFQDPNANVVYLARPCQYVADPRCTQTDWTTGRFAQPIITSATQAVMQIARKRPLILIGYSGGALLSGLMIQKNPKLPVQKWITLAGVLNHQKWTQDLKLPPLTQSVNLTALPHVPQQHFVGDKDKIVSAKMTQTIVPAENLTIVPGATHSSGFETIMPLLYQP